MQVCRFMENSEKDYQLKTGDGNFGSVFLLAGFSGFCFIRILDNRFIVGKVRLNRSCFMPAIMFEREASVNRQATF